jgi:hypothetical protein
MGVSETRLIPVMGVPRTRFVDGVSAINVARLLSPLEGSSCIGVGR